MIAWNGCSRSRGTGAQHPWNAHPSVGAARRAVSAAAAAWPKWAKTPSLRRAQILDRFKTILWERADQLAEVISAEHGKTHDDAKGHDRRGVSSPKPKRLPANRKPLEATLGPHPEAKTRASIRENSHRESRISVDACHGGAGGA